MATMGLEAMSIYPSRPTVSGGGGNVGVPDAT
jgi:hypothetical protein